MKKLMILAVAAIALVACSKTFEVTPTPETPIGFGTWANVLTKARATASDNTAFQTGDAFDVFGFKTVGGTDKVVFNGDDVEATLDGSTVTWDYDNHRFWDPAASKYTFFAVLPNDKLVAEGENPTDPYATTGKFNSIDITFDDPTNKSNDILVACKKEVTGTGSAAPYSYSGAVNLAFNHIASCVDILVKSDATLDGAELKVTALSLLNIKNNGKFAVSAYGAADPWAPTVGWSAPTATATTLTTDGQSAGVYIVPETFPITASGETTYTSHVGATTGTAATLLSGYVFMPQTIAANTQKIKLSYTIKATGEAEASTYSDIEIDLYDFIQTDKDLNPNEYTTETRVSSWEPGTHYYYYITIGANAISFTASVNNWAATTISGYQHLIN